MLNDHIQMGVAAVPQALPAVGRRGPADRTRTINLTMTGRVFSINISKEKGIPKEMVSSCILRAGFGIEGDAHAGSGKRQVSLLSIEAIEKFESEASKKGVEIRPGIFAENITTEGIALEKLKVGDRLSAGDNITLKVTAIGKECHSGCSITRSVGRCIMPKQGVFAEVEAGGALKIHDKIMRSRSRFL